MFGTYAICSAQPKHVQTVTGAVSVRFNDEQAGDTNLVFVQLTNPSNPVLFVSDTQGFNYKKIAQYGDMQAWIATNVHAGADVILTSGSTKQVIASEYSGVNAVDHAEGYNATGYSIPVGFVCAGPYDELVVLIEATTPFTWPNQAGIGWVEANVNNGKILLKDMATSLVGNVMFAEAISSAETHPTCTVMTVSLNKAGLAFTMPTHPPRY